MTKLLKAWVKVYVGAPVVSLESLPSGGGWKRMPLLGPRERSDCNHFLIRSLGPSGLLKARCEDSSISPKTSYQSRLVSWFNKSRTTPSTPVLLSVWYSYMKLLQSRQTYLHEESITSNINKLTSLSCKHKHHTMSSKSSKRILKSINSGLLSKVKENWMSCRLLRTDVHC